jgi:hypothetical protein
MKFLPIKRPKKKYLGIDIQTKHIYNLIGGKSKQKTTLTVNSFQNQPTCLKKSI